MNKNDETLRHANYLELADFARSVFMEYNRNDRQSELKRMFEAGTGVPAKHAFQQFIIEVGDGYGFGGISNMSPRDWFNSDLPQRQNDADVIAAIYQRYKSLEDDAPVTEAKDNDVQAEIAKLRDELKALAEAVTKQTEATDAEVDKAAGKEDTAAEEKDESKAEVDAEEKDKGA